LGREQSATVTPKLAPYGKIDLVIVSPLSRTIQTALVAIPEGPKIIVDERIRERNGKHPCDKRRPVAELKADFPMIDFSSLKAEEDDTWTPAREPWEKLVARAGDFCRALHERPEESVAIVTHNDFLQALLLEAPELKTAEPALRKKFQNAEMMPLWFWAQPASVPCESPVERAKPEFSPRATA
jgi:broad specificity phosphatase PhoE